MNCVPGTLGARHGPLPGGGAWGTDHKGQRPKVPPRPQSPWLRWSWGPLKLRRPPGAAQPHCRPGMARAVTRQGHQDEHTWEPWDRQHSEGTGCSSKSCFLPKNKMDRLAVAVSFPGSSVPLCSSKSSGRRRAGEATSLRQRSQLCALAPRPQLPEIDSSDQRNRYV